MIIEINGKKVGTKFNNWAIFKLPGYIKYSGIDELDGINFLCAILWAGYQGWCYAKEIEPELTFENIVDFVDDAAYNEVVGEQLATVAKELRESRQYENFIKASDDEKKSQQESMNGTKSTNMPSES